MRKRLGILGIGAALTLAGCADRPSSPTSNGAEQGTIIGGKPDTTDRSIFLIAIGNGGLCSGTLILPNLVLTAHHCVSDMTGMNGVVACGSTTFRTPFPPSDFQVSWDDSLTNGAVDSSIYDVTAVTVPTDTDVCGNDIALLELATNVPASAAVPLAPRLDVAVETDETFNAIGYGITNPNDSAGNTAGTRMRFDGASVICVGETECRGTGATATEWVAEAPVCSGDSGGPALDPSNRVIGVVSRGPEPCDMAVYSAVYPWRELIVGAATDAAADGGYEPPGWVTGAPGDGGAPMADGGTPMTDAGMGDAGPTADGGVLDGGPRDAGPMDAGPMDAGPASDAGTMDAGTMDAGSMLDGGTRMDAGMGADAATPMDASAPDSGSAMMDASTPKPSGGLAGAGNHGQSSSADDDDEPASPAGCGCRTARTSNAADFGASAWALALALATVARRRRKR